MAIMKKWAVVHHGQKNEKNRQKAPHTAGLFLCLKILDDTLLQHPLLLRHLERRRRLHQLEVRPAVGVAARKYVVAVLA